MVARGLARLWAWTAARACATPACTSSPTAAGMAARPRRRAAPAASTSSSCATRTPTDDELLAAAASRARAAATPPARCSSLNDRPDLARRRRRRRRARRPGRHAGRRARASSSAPTRSSASRRTRSQQVDAGAAAAPTTSPSGPVHATPTKRAGPAIGLELVRYAAAHVARPVVRDRRHRRRRPSAPWSRPARGASSSCARSPRPTTPRRRRARCAPRVERGAPWRRRSRKRRPGAGPPVAAPPPASPSGGRMRRGYARAEERNAAVRAELEPLAPGERPPALVVAAVVAAAARRSPTSSRWAAGLDVEGKRARRLGVLLFAARHARSPPGACGTRRYWAVLGFEALLGDHRSSSLALSLLVASNVARRRAVRRDHRPGRLAVLEAHPRDGQAPGSAARSLDSGALWLTPSTTASSSARVRAATSPRSAPPSSA